MYYFPRTAFVLLIILIQMLVGSAVLAIEGAKGKLPKSEFKQLKWSDLIPKDDLDALRAPPAYLKLIGDDVSAEELAKLQGKDPAHKRYQQALTSTQYIKELHGRPSRIPGFVVPVGFGDGKKITSFFLVPYFGACIHEPAPPPNQVIFVEYPKGLVQPHLDRAIVVLGVLKTEVVEKGVATSAYTMEMDYLETYGK